MITRVTGPCNRQPQTESPKAPLAFRLTSLRAVFVLTLFGFALGCGGDRDLVLARVGDAQIRASDMATFVGRLTEERKTKQSGVDGYLDYLQTLIDKEVLAQEALKLELDKVPSVWRKLKAEKDRRAVKEFMSRQTREEIVLTEEELRQHQIDTGRDYQIRIRRILLTDIDAAKEAAGRLRAGETFSQVAAAAPVDSSRYLLADELDPPILRDIVFPLNKGEISEPVLYAGVYGVYEVLDKRPIALKDIQPLMEQEVRAGRIPEFVEAISRRLAEEVDFATDDDALAGMVGILERGIDQITPQEHRTVLMRFKGGSFSVQDYVDLILMHNIGFGDDLPDRVRWFTHEVVIPHVLMMEGARSAGIYDEEDFVAWFERRQLSLMLQEIRNVSLAEVFVDDEEGRKYYRENPGQFVPMESLIVREILVQTEGEAAYLREQIEQGADMAALATEHTLRPHGKADGGKFHIHTFETTQFGDLIDAARSTRPGALIGPVEVAAPSGHDLQPDPDAPPHYSIFTVLESTIGAGPQPYEEVKRRAKALVHRNKNNRAFYQYLLELRVEYEPRIEILHANVEQLAQQSPL